MTHSLSNTNYQQRYATCSECGPLTPVYVSVNRTNGRKSALCMIGKRESMARTRLRKERAAAAAADDARRADMIASERERVAREEAEERRTRFIAEERARIAREEAEGGWSPYR